MIKAKLHEITGMPAGKQKLQLGVSTVTVISIKNLHTVEIAYIVYVPLWENLVLGPRSFLEMISDIYTLLYQFIVLKTWRGDHKSRIGADHVAERNEKTSSGGFQYSEHGSTWPFGFSWIY